MQLGFFSSHKCNTHSKNIFWTPVLLQENLSPSSARMCDSANNSFHFCIHYIQHAKLEIQLKIIPSYKQHNTAFWMLSFRSSSMQWSLLKT